MKSKSNNNRWLSRILVYCLAGLSLGCIPYAGSPAASQEIPFDLPLAKRVVEEVRAGRVVPDPSANSVGAGRIPLSGQFASAAFLEEIYVTREADGTLFVFFPTGGCRSSNTGYLYSSKPLTGGSVKINCGWSDRVAVPLVRQISPHWWRTHGDCSQT